MAIAHAAPPSAPPGLVQVCDRYAEEPGADEAMGSAFEAMTHPPVCDLAADRGICLFGGATLLVTAEAGMSVIPFEPTATADPAAEQTLFFATRRPLWNDGGSRTLSVSVRGKPLFDGAVVNGALELEATLLPPDKIERTRWTLVLYANDGHSLALEFDPVPFDGDAAPVTVSAGPDGTGQGTRYSMVARRKLGWVVVQTPVFEIDVIDRD